MVKLSGEDKEVGAVGKGGRWRRMMGGGHALGGGKG
jgi:hypothetical protein